MMNHRGFTVLAYLDDFLIVSDTAVECQLAYQALIKLLSELGFKINWDEAVGPCQRLTFLGIGIGTVRRQLTLPERKLCELRLLLRETTAKRSIAKRHVESLVGKLNFAARVVFTVRTDNTATLSAISEALPVTRVSCIDCAAFSGYRLVITFA